MKPVDVVMIAVFLAAGGLWLLRDHPRFKLIAAAVAAAFAAAVAFIAGRIGARREEPQGDASDHEPVTFDDNPERETDRAADDLDAGASRTDHDLDDLRDRNRRLRERLQGRRGDRSASGEQR